MNTIHTGGLIHIGQVIQNAIVFDFKRSRGGIADTDSPVHPVARLFELLDERRIEYLLVGNIALLHYVEGRNSEDIDLIAAVVSLENLPEIEIVEQNEYFARGKFGGLQIDLLLTRNPLFLKVQQSYAITQQFLERAIPSATVEGLLLLKMYALPSLYRQGSFARVGIYENDIATLMHDYRPQIEPLYTELAAHLSQADLAAVREIIAEIQQRIERFHETSEKVE